MKTTVKKIIPLFMVVILLLASAPQMLAVDTENLETRKEEVVYVKLEGDGKPKEFYVVNIFTLDGGGIIRDYGDYSSVRNMTTHDSITQTGDSLTIKTEADKLYYEGELNNAQLPWSIAVQYTLDGNDILPSSLAGSQGALEILISIINNPEAAEGFYENYALEVSVQLDTQICSNIDAPGATLANVGKDKQITYTVLPGRGLNAAISADVRDFQMDGISINGVGLALNLDIDTSELSERVKELQYGISRINSGAAELNRGTRILDDGMNTLSNGTGVLCDGANELYKGMAGIEDGAQRLRSGMEITKYGAADIQNALTLLRENSDAILAGSAGVSDALLQMRTALESFEELLFKLGEIFTAFESAKTEIEAFCEVLNNWLDNLRTIDVTELISTNSAALCELEQAEQTYLIDFSDAKEALKKNNLAWESVERAQASLGGLIEDADGLNANFIEIFDWIKSLYARLEEAYNGLMAFKNGIYALEAAYNDPNTGMDVNLNAYMAGVDAVADGYEMLYSALYGNNGVLMGLDMLSNGISDARLASRKLYNGAQELNSGAGRLARGMEGLLEGSATLSRGTQTLYEGTATMDDEINERIDEMIAELSGSGGAATSFVSTKNTGIQGVQFVMSTDPIAKPQAPAHEDEPEQQLNFFERLLALFGL